MISPQKAERLIENATPAQMQELFHAIFADRDRLLDQVAELRRGEKLARDLIYCLDMAEGFE